MTKVIPLQLTVWKHYIKRQWPEPLLNRDSKNAPKSL